MISEHKRSMRHLCVVVAFGVIVTLGATTFGVRLLLNRNIEESVSYRLRCVDNIFHEMLGKESQVLHMQIDALLADKKMTETWANRDRDGLYQQVKPLFNNIRDEYDITHFYFIDTDRTCFLRAYKPERYGDTVKHITLGNSIESGEKAYGIEIGHYGTFTMRLVHPWLVDGEVAGYIELGMEIDHLTPLLQDALQSQLVFMIDKSKLDQKDWEQGALISKHGESWNWDQFSDRVVIGSTLEYIPSHLQKIISESSGQGEDILPKIDIDGRVYRGGFVGLSDAGKTKVGVIAVLYDVTEDYMSANTILAVLTTIIVMLGAALWVVFRVFDERFTRNMNMLTGKAETDKEMHATVNKEKRKFRQQIIEQENLIKELSLKAEEANLTKKELLANISHGIRTPMNSIVGFSGLLSMEELGENQMRYVDHIKTSSRNILGLIDDIFDFSVAGSGAVNIKKTDCVLADLIEEINSLLVSSAKEKGIEFAINLGQRIPEIIRTDALRLRQCVVNLANNAIRYTDKGHVHINVSLINKDGRDAICFDIEDTGLGIPEDEQAVIFSDGENEDVSVSAETANTKLNFETTERLLLLLDGELSFISKVGHGTVFSIIIPAGTEDTPKKSIKERKKMVEISHEEPVCQKQDRVLSGKVLVAEDSLPNQILMQALLKKLDLDITIVEDGQKALEAIGKESFDMIFMDIQMPNMNGYEATEAIRAKGILTPIIALTANAMQGDCDKCLDAGCDDYMSKPIDIAKLNATVKKYQEQIVSGEGLSEKTHDIKNQLDGLSKLCEETIGSEDKDKTVSLIEWDKAMRYCGDEKVIDRISSKLVEDLPGYIGSTTEAIESGDVKNTILYSHKIKGSVLTIGVSKLAEIAGQIETAATDNDMEKAGKVLPGLEPAYAELKEFLGRPDWKEIAKRN